MPVGRLILLATLLAAPAPASADFTLLRTFAPGGGYGTPVRLSADGRTVAAEGWTWSAAGYRDFATEPGVPGAPRVGGLSANGATIVGSYYDSQGRLSPFRDRGPGTFEPLPRANAWTHNVTTDVSDDGNAVVGYGFSPLSPQTGSFLWTPEHGTEVLNLGPTVVISYARAISGDGRTVVGSRVPFLGFGTAFTWTRDGGVVDLPMVGGPDGSNDAFAINHDGSIIVGEAARIGHAVLWRDGSGFDLGIAAGFRSSRAVALSEDGTVVGGWLLDTFSHPTAAVWTPGGGMQTLESYLRTLGITTPPGLRLQTCTGISADGLTFAGTAVDASGAVSAFTATIPEPGTLLLLGLALAARRRRGAPCG